VVAKTGAAEKKGHCGDRRITNRVQETGEIEARKEAKGKAR